jgi:ABC-type molybdate transport system substrate-binding protein
MYRAINFVETQTHNIEKSRAYKPKDVWKKIDKSINYYIVITSNASLKKLSKESKAFVAYLKFLQLSSQCSQERKGCLLQRS